MSCTITVDAAKAGVLSQNKGVGKLRRLMSLNQPNNPRLTIPWLTGAPVVGLIAGFVTIGSMHIFGLPDMLQGEPAIGAIFGALCGFYLWIFRQISLWKVGILTLSFVGAYALALRSTIASIALLSRFHAPGDFTSPDNFFLSGMLGAFIVLATILFSVFPDRIWWRVLGKAFVFSFVGGGLAFAGGYLAPTIGPILVSLMERLGMNPALVNGGPTPPAVAELVYSVHVVWQTGMAVLLAVLIWLERRNAVTQSEDNPPITDPVTRPARGFPVAGWILFSLTVVPTVTLEYDQHLSEQARATRGPSRKDLADCAAKAPPSANFPRSNIAYYKQDRSVMGEVLITENIGPYLVRNGDSTGSAAQQFPVPDSDVIRNVSPTVTYTMNYERSGVTKPGDDSFAVSVHIVEYPNPEWAAYELGNHPVFCAAKHFPYSRDLSKRPVPLGGTVLEYNYSPSPNRVFYWTAGNKLISILYGFSVVPENDPLFDAYLKKYPSSVTP